MRSFYEWLEPLKLKESRESDLFEPEPDPEPISASHEVKRVFKKGSDRTPFYSKASYADDLQTINEYLAYNLYKVFGIRVADEAHLVIDKENRIRIVTSQVTGQQLPPQHDPVPLLRNTDFKDGFFVDAFLGNWDVIGTQPRFNIFIDDKNAVTRIDTGGMDFRAMGGRKGNRFGPQVDELASFAGIGGVHVPGHTSDVFRGMSQDELKKASKIFLSVPWNKIEDKINEVSHQVQRLALDHNLQEIGKMAFQYIQRMAQILKSRFDDLHQKIARLGL